MTREREMPIKGVHCRQWELHPDGGLWEPVLLTVGGPERTQGTAGCLKCSVSFSVLPECKGLSQSKHSVIPLCSQLGLPGTLTDLSLRTGRS